MADSEDPRREHIEGYIDDIVSALERELDTARDLSRQHADTIRSSQRRNEPVLIERRRKPR